MYRALFARDVFAELDRMQREMQEAFDLSPSIRGLGRGVGNRDAGRLWFPAWQSIPLYTKR